MACIDDLNAAKAALHALMIGKQTISVQYEGRRVQYSAATRGDLLAYIAQLEGECGESPATAQRGAPFEVSW